MSEGQDFDDLDEKLVVLEQSMGGAQSMASEFSDALKAMRGSLSETSREMNGLSKGLSKDLKGAFSDAIIDRKSLAEALGQAGRSMANKAVSAAVNPVAQGIGSMMASGAAGLLSGAFAKGAGFAQGRVLPFANGGVVSGPTTFPMRGGVGLMGEAGPEAIMPLTRGADGKLGVRSQGSGRTVNVTMNVSTPDVQSFRRSQSQLSAQMQRMLSRGERNR